MNRPDPLALAAARAIVNEYVLHNTSERESLAWTIARIIERHYKRPVQTTEGCQDCLSGIGLCAKHARLEDGWG